MNRSKLAFVILLSSLALPARQTQPEQSPTITIKADLTDAPRKLLHAELTFPAHPGPMTFYYPKWIPGEHAPSGPIDNLAGLVFSAEGVAIPWQRDSLDMYAIRVTVPNGATKLTAKLDFLATAAPTGFSAGASTSANLAVLNWNELVLYPAGTPASDIQFEPSVKIPTGWKLGTALTSVSTEANTARFKPVPLSVLIDSPLIAGRFFKEIALAPDVTPHHFLDIVADDPEDLEISDDQVNSYNNLVEETGALFKSRHYGSYHFLLTLSDQVAHFGLEHHESSDDRLEARALLEEDLQLLDADLLPHEFTHSWNGKYRRPAGLVTADYQQPMKSDLLWVYEGLTQYLGDVLATRSGLWTAARYRAYLAASAAEMDHRPGRKWRDLQDTATASQTLYSAPNGWDNWRRAADYYAEGELLWLQVDTTIRRLSNGKSSLNTFCAQFFGAGGNTSAETVPYTFEDLMAALNAVHPYDWAGFFRERLNAPANHAPLAGIEEGGYRIEYTDQANEHLRATENEDRGVEAWYSLGINTSSDNTIKDVLIDSPAYQAGLGPGMKLIAVNGRRASEEILRQAIRSTKSGQPVELIVDNDSYVRVLKINYGGGEEYPHLLRTSNSHAYLDEILQPMVRHTRRASLH